IPRHAVFHSGMTWHGCVFPLVCCVETKIRNLAVHTSGRRWPSHIDSRANDRAREVSMTRNGYRHAACLAGTLFGAGAVFGQAEQGSFFRGLGFLGADGQASAAMCVTPDGLYVGGVC